VPKQQNMQKYFMSLN